ncbi:hypothetical protein EI94DRAFT_1759410 [Lactarius quietus]|nr:hypothetical protein EI94DRAFT_1759410 [Lactarius quietus]
MDSSAANTWEYQQQAIDAVIKSHEKYILALKYRRNALAPISSLPFEVIANIFFLSSLRYCSGSADDQPFIHHVLRVAHVCHRWREVALDYPFLWSHLHFNTISPAGATEILARARMAPLYLEARLPLHYWPKHSSPQGSPCFAFCKRLQNHVPHVYQYHLRIRADPLHLNNMLEGLIWPAPILEHLSISMVGGLQHRNTSRVSVPDTLFDATTPRLSSLELRDCDINWKSPLPKSLKNLEIITLSVNARPSLTDWLDALDEMRQLQSLVLHSASPSTPHPRSPFNIKRTVTLPFLEHINISAPVLDCGLALAHLVLPALTSLSVTITSDYLNIAHLQKILPYVVQHAHGPLDIQPLREMTISGHRTHLEILVWTTPNTNVFGIDVEPVRMELSVPSLDRSVDRDRILDATMATLPLDGLVALTVPRNTQLEEPFWLHHAPRWSLLKHVRLAPCPAHGFRETLLHDNGGREHPILPSLTHLQLFRSALSARRTFRLCDTLMKRVEQGVPLEVLDLRTCSATSLAVQLLSEIVELEITETDDRAHGHFVYDNNSEGYYVV